MERPAYSESTPASEKKDPQDYQFECALDDESFSPCSSPMSYNMDMGKHNFVVRIAPY